jgi:RNA polymerase sigma factor (sigma-70 family)
MTEHGPSDDVQRLLAEASWLRRLARSLVRDDATADDVVQDTLVAAVCGAPRDAGSVRGWLASVARNAARRRWRGERRRTAREAAVARPEASAAETETAERLDVCRALLDAVDALEEPYRTAVRLRWLDGLPPRQVAAQLGLPAELVWKRLSRGLAMLRARLDRERGGRRAWIVLVADLGGVRPREIPWGPLVAAAAGVRAVVAAIVVVTLTAAGVALLADGASERTVNLASASPESDARQGSTGSNEATRRTVRARAAAPLGVSAEPHSEPTHAPTPPVLTAPDPPPVPQDRIVGRILAPNGTPVASAAVERYGGNGPTGAPTVHAGEDGRFVLAQPGDGTKDAVLRIASQAWADATLRLPRLDPGVIDVGDVRVEEALAIRGRVTDSEGEPIPRASVRATLVSDTRLGFSKITGEDGRFRFLSTRAGSWRIYVVAPEPSGAWARRFVHRTVDAGTEDVVFVLRRREPPRARLLLDVVDGSGAPLPIARSGARRISGA